MDRQQAAIHYIEQAELALLSMLQWCNDTYGPPAGDKVARMLMDKVFGQNLINYCELTEVLEMWADVSRLYVAERTYAAEFIISMYQHFSMYVEPAVHSDQVGDRRDSLSPLGAHLVGAIGRSHNTIKDLDTFTEFKDDMESYLSYFGDVPTPAQVIAILSVFPWMSVLYLLSFSNSITLKNLLAKFTFEPGQTPEAGTQ